MGEVKKEDILEILAGYDKSEITLLYIFCKVQKKKDLEPLSFVKKEEKFHIKDLALQMNTSLLMNSKTLSTRMFNKNSEI